MRDGSFIPTRASIRQVVAASIALVVALAIASATAAATDGTVTVSDSVGDTLTETGVVATGVPDLDIRSLRLEASDGLMLVELEVASDAVADLADRGALFLVELETDGDTLTDSVVWVHPGEGWRVSVTDTAALVEDGVPSSRHGEATVDGSRVSLSVPIPSVAPGHPLRFRAQASLTNYPDVADFKHPGRTTRREIEPTWWAWITDSVPDDPEAWIEFQPTAPEPSASS